MRLINVNNIQGEEVLAQPVIDINGRRLLAKGVRLKPIFLEKLVCQGIYSVYIEDEISEGIEIDDILTTQTRMKAKKTVQEELIKYVEKGKIDSVKIKNQVSDIIDEILQNHDQLLNLKDIRMQDEYIFSHSVNVCILSTLLAKSLGFNHSKIMNIATGALLHDFGKVIISPDILCKDSNLSPYELDELHKHPLYGYNLLKNDLNINSSVKIAVLTHHERIDGSGYPLGLEKEKIHYSAKIIAICDMFDSITSDRKYKNALSTASAVEYLISASSKTLDETYVNAFLKHIPIFPTGTLVLLNNGLIGIVLKNNIQKLTKPLVRIVFNPRTKTKYGSNYVINLANDNTIRIIKEVIIPYNEVKPED